MRFRTLLNVIESIRFSVRATVESSMYRMLRRLARQPEVQDLLAIARDRNVATSILDRALQLASEAVDVRYDHPSDIAFVTYLLVLGATQPDLAKIAAETISSITTAWFASRYALDVLSDRTVSTAESSTSTRQFANSSTALTTRTPTSTERVLMSGLVASTLREPLRVAEISSCDGNGRTVEFAAIGIVPIQGRISFPGVLRPGRAVHAVNRDSSTSRLQFVGGHHD